MDSVLMFFTVQHDSRLILLAIVIAGAAGFVSVVAYAHLLARSSGRHTGWLLLTALCLSMGIWASHVIMALSLVAAKQAYQPLLGLLSFATAFGTAAAGIALSARGGRALAAAGGAIIGFGAALTHFVGMGAFTFTGAPDLNPLLAGAATLVAVALSSGAIVVARENTTSRGVALASGLLGAGIAIALIIAMAALSLPEGVAVAAPAQRLVETLSAAGAAAMAVFAMIGCYAAAMLDGRTLRANFSQFGELVDAVAEGIVIAHDGRIVGANACALELTGRKLDELEGKSVMGELLNTKRKLTAPGAIRKFDATLIGAADRVPVLVMRKPLHAMARANEVYVIRDLREKVQASDRNAQLAAELAEKQSDLRGRNILLEVVLSNMSEGLCMFDAEQRVILSNERYATIYNLQPDAVKPGTHLRDIVQKRIDKGLYAAGSPKAYMDEYLAPIEEPGETLHELNDGRVISIHRRPMPGGGWITTHEDVTKQRRIEQENLHLTEHDTLTLLPNRTSLRRLLDETVAAAGLKNRKLAVLMVNIDNFREVNDTLGHATGDALLKAVSERLRTHTRKATLLARFGDDEFVLVEAVDQPGRDAAALAGRIQEQLRLPYNLEGTVVTVGTTLGVAIAPADGKSADVLLRRADLALYRAKKEARGTFSFFQPTMEKHLKERLSLEHDLSEALARGEFEIYYQPLVKIADNQVTGLEALLRWNRPGHGVTLPEVFVPIAEAGGLMPTIGEWVLRRACTEAAGWPEHIKLSVNISPSQFNAHDFVRTVISALAASGLAATRLELEVTENMLGGDIENTQTTLRQLSDAGVGITLDDFGIGFASLSYLRRYPVSRVKIDRSFVGTLGEADSQVMLRILTRLGASLKIATTAEGVETKEQLDMVRAEGCDEMQGHYFSRPKTVQEVRALLAPPEADSAVA